MRLYHDHCFLGSTYHFFRTDPVLGVFFLTFGQSFDPPSPKRQVLALKESPYVLVCYSAEAEDLELGESGSAPSSPTGQRKEADLGAGSGRGFENSTGLLDVHKNTGVLTHGHDRSAVLLDPGGPFGLVLGFTIRPTKVTKGLYP